jgi:hypothetical protein
MMALCAVFVSQMAMMTADAATIRFGYSGLHALSPETYDGMNVDARRSHLESRSQLASSLGADVLRTGDAVPLLLERAEDGEIDWTALDHTVGVMLAPGIEVCVTLPEVPSVLEKPAFNAFIAAVIERYDGDLDFGVGPLELNQAFPDINGSGSITNDDWEASPEVQLAWAAAHQLVMLEVGQRVRQLEDSTNMGDGDYADHLAMLADLASSADEPMSIMLGSVWVHEDSQQRFVSRLEALDDEMKASIAASNVTVYGELTSPDVSDAVINIDKFESWLGAADLGESSRWVGSLSVPSAANSDGGGPCDDARCSERSQVNGLVRLTTTALAAGYTALLYERPIELVGQGVSADAWTSSGLLELEAVAGIDLAVLPLKPRPAYAVWRWLQSTFAEVSEADFTTLHDTPQGVEGLSLPSGWLIWFDWLNGASPGADYAGEERPVVLTGLTSASLRVQSLWPESVCAQLGDDGQCEVTWTETYVAVVEGAAQIIVGQDPIWVEASDVDVEAEGGSPVDAGPTDEDASSEEDTSVGPTADGDAPSTDPVDEGGCGAGQPPQGWLGLLALLAAWMIRSRSARVCAERRDLEGTTY